MEPCHSSVLLQKHVRDNTEEVHDFLTDLRNWEKEIKETEHRLSSQCSEKSKSAESPAVPPVRCRSDPLTITPTTQPTKTTCKATKAKNKCIVNDKVKKKKRMPCDYAAWEKFDVDKALESEEEEQKNSKHGGGRTPKTSKKERANCFKEEGNKLYSNGRLEDAVAKYTQGMALDPSNALLPANRAMAYIKLNKYTAAEADCNKCLKLDSSYTKGYLRRATARLNLGKQDLALRDYQKVIELEPSNKEAQKEMKKLESSLSSTDEKVSAQPPSNKDSAIQQYFEDPQSEPHVQTEKSEQTSTREREHKVNVEKTGQKRERAGKKLQIIEVNSQRDNTPLIPDKPWQVLPIDKPPHLRSMKPLKRIAVKDIASKKDLIEKPPVVPCEASPREKNPQSRLMETISSVETAVLCVSEKAKDDTRMVVPSVPKTSHLFTQEWDRLSGHPHLGAEYLKLIPSAFFSNADLETNTLVTLASVLGSEEVSASLAAEHFSALSSSPNFSISLMFLEPNQRQVFLDLISKCKQIEAYSTKMEKLQADIISGVNPV